MCLPKTIKQKKIDQEKVESLLRSIDSYRSWYQDYSVRQLELNHRLAMISNNVQQQSQSQEQQHPIVGQLSQEIGQRHQRNDRFQQWQLPMERQRQLDESRRSVAIQRPQPTTQRQSIERLQPVTTSSNISYFNRRSINIQPIPTQRYRPTQQDERILNQMTFTRNIFQRMQFIADRETMDIFLNPDDE